MWAFWNKWRPNYYRQTPDDLGVGVADMAFVKGVGDPLYMTQIPYLVRGQLYSLEGNHAYTNQGLTAVSIDPMSQGFAGDLALQALVDLASQPPASTPSP